MPREDKLYEAARLARKASNRLDELDSAAGAGDGMLYSASRDIRARLPDAIRWLDEARDLATAVLASTEPTLRAKS